MSEKLQVTAEQHVALKDFFSFFKESPLKTFTAHGKLFNAEYKSLINLTIDQMATAQFVGYEVEKPKFEVGDWVTRIKTNNLGASDVSNNHNEGKIFRIVELAKGYCYDETHYAHHFGYIRHATKEEIIFAELGREVGEFVEGDVYTYSGNHMNKIDGSSAIGVIRENYKLGKIKGFYPASSFIKLP